MRVFRVWGGARKHGAPVGQVKMFQLFLIATLTALPLLGIVATVLLEKHGCHGGTASMGADEPFCMIKGINFGAVFETVGSIAFFAIILAPLTLLWIIGGTIIFVRAKRKSA